MGVRARLAAGASALVVLAACGGGSPDGTGAPAGEERRSEDATPAAGDAQLIESQPTIPREPADEFADIATDAADAAGVWRRFGLAGDVPEVDFDTSALLFVGLGESGSCSARFDGVETDGASVRVVVGIELPSAEEDGGVVCTDDYNPRTFVVQVARDALPDGTFELTLERTRFALSTVARSEPPAGSSVVGESSAEDPDLDLAADPDPVDAGAPVELILTNHGDVGAMTGGWGMVLLRWDRQRWLPAADAPRWGEDHPAIAVEPVDVAPGSTQRIATVDSDGLDPGWYGVFAKLQLRGAGGYVAVQEAFEVTAD